MQRISKPLLLTHEAIRVAKENGEDCKHLDLMNITINLKNMNLNDHSKVQVKVKCLKCDNKFTKTQNIIQRTFFTEF
jgi:hypothetical protein